MEGGDRGSEQRSRGISVFDDIFGSHDRPAEYSEHDADERFRALCRIRDSQGERLEFEGRREADRPGKLAAGDSRRSMRKRTGLDRNTCRQRALFRSDSTVRITSTVVFQSDVQSISGSVGGCVSVLASLADVSHGSDSPELDAMIEVENLTKTYQAGSSEVRALRGISCKIPSARVTFILGPSGSGKSTLLYLLGALDHPTSGRITCDGREISGLSSEAGTAFRRDSVGFIFQNFNLLGNLNVVDNVLVSYIPRGESSRHRDEAISLLSRVGLGSRLAHLPHQLSGGEQQRVAIVRAILKRPQIVLADEPTGELDSENGAEVFGYLRELSSDRGTTVVVVTHDQTHIRAGDNILHVRDGQLQSRC